MRVNDIIPGIVLAICSVLLLLYARTLPPMAGLAYGPGTFPAVIAYGLLIGAVGLTLSGWRQRASGDRSTAVGRKPWHPGAFLYALSVPAAVVAYMWLEPVLGFPVVAFLLVAAMIAWLTRRYWLAVIVAFCTATVMWYAFAVALQVPLRLSPF